MRQSYELHSPEYEQLYTELTGAILILLEEDGI